MKVITLRLKSPDEWARFFTKHGFGGVGVHFKLPPVKSEKVRRKGKR